jgi:ArsR family transcriptional regulator, arsenate/arsenite/antimonite-responsive transcriptional repressor
MILVKPSMETLFQAMGDATRLRLLNLMAGGEVCVCFFVEVLGQGQPKISRHLAYLRRAGLVKSRREGKWMHYGLVGPLPAELDRIFQATLETLGADPAMRRDRAALARSCCSSRVPEQLLRAPRPAMVEAPASRR